MKLVTRDHAIIAKLSGTKIKLASNIDFATEAYLCKCPVVVCILKKLTNVII